MPDKQTKEEIKKQPGLLLPKAKLSGSREWITNLFSPNKSRNPSTSTAGDESTSRYIFQMVELIHSYDFAIGRSASVEASEKSETENDHILSVEIVTKPVEPISTMCSSMRRQIICRAFYGWLAHCRHMKIVRKHLGGLTFEEKPVSVSDVSWHHGVTEDWWKTLDWEWVRNNDQDFEKEIHLKIYLGGIVASLRAQIWPYLLGHYAWKQSPEDKAKVDKKVKSQYENKLSDWMAIEAIVRQRDRETTAANIAKLTGMLTIFPPILHDHLT